MLTMDRQQALEYVNSQEPTFLTKAKVGWICPNPKCGNGSGSSGTGITKDPNTGRYHCFKCNLHEDIPGLWKVQNGTESMGRALDEVYSYYGVEIEETPTGSSTDTHSSMKTDTYTHTHTQDGKTKKMDIDIALCMENLKNVGYAPMKKRGISEKTSEKYRIGLAIDYKTKDAYTDSYVTWPEALVIPTGPAENIMESYVVRNLDPTAREKNRYRKNGKSRVYRKKYLQKSEKPIIIVEGELDAISIVEAGGEAVALGSIANVNKFLDLVKEKEPAQPLILALDNDEGGIAATETLEEGLSELHIPFQRINLYDSAKDANEALQRDSEALRRAIEEAEATATAQAQQDEEEAQQAAKEEYMQTSTAAHIQEFINGIADSVNTPYIPTGFTKLDEALDGGLFEGLYILGAVSSLGKTSFILQCCDQIAEGGNDVLIFSLEMARSELMAKSISRLTLLDVIQNNGNTRDAKTTRGITTGKRYADYSQGEKELIQRATMAYSEYAGNIYIHEGIGDIGTDTVRQTVKKHIELTGKRPVVVIDYIQILAPYDVRATDKQNTDKAVLELKRISRDFKIPVIGISSFNRENYTAPVNMASFKESGSIEYSSDCLFGMQFKGAGKKDFEAEEAMKKNPRDVELVILKNRNGATGARLEYEYYKLFNYFKEV